MDNPDPLGHLVGGLGAQIHQLLPEGFISFPASESPMSKEVFVVQLQFLEAGSGDARLLDLKFSGSP